MAIEKEKPDLWTVLKRRRRTVAQFLEEAGVHTLSGLKTLVHSLQTVYTVSNKFMTEANGYVLSKVAEREAKKKEEIKEAAKEAADKKEENEVSKDGKEEDRPKKKRRRVRSSSSKSSTSKSAKSDNKANTSGEDKGKASKDAS